MENFRCALDARPDAGFVFYFQSPKFAKNIQRDRAKTTNGNDDGNKIKKFILARGSFVRAMGSAGFGGERCLSE